MHRFPMKHFFAFSFFLIALVFAGRDADAATVRDSQPDTVAPQTYEYVTRDGKPLLLDVYISPSPRSDSACVVFLFGGGFIMGSRTDVAVRRYCQKLTKNGYTAVAIDYRLHLREVDFDTISLWQSQFVFRDAINFTAADCAAAIAWLCGHAAEIGVSPNKIVLCGSSAGAIGALQLDYCRANALPPAAELPEGWKPAAVVAYSGAVYADKGRPSYKTQPVPTFFLHGNKDRIVHFKKFPPVLRSGLYGPKKLHKVFEKNDYPHWFFVYDGIGHEVATLIFYTLPEFEAFVDKSLKGRSMHYDATLRDDSVVPTKWSKMSTFDLYKGK